MELKRHEGERCRGKVSQLQLKYSDLIAINTLNYLLITLDQFSKSSYIYYYIPLDKNTKQYSLHVFKRKQPAPTECMVLFPVCSYT